MQHVVSTVDRRSQTVVTAGVCFIQLGKTAGAADRDGAMRAGSGLGHEMRSYYPVKLPTTDLSYCPCTKIGLDREKFGVNRWRKYRKEIRRNPGS